MQKKIFILAVVALILIGGVVFVWQKKTGQEVSQTEVKNTDVKVVSDDWKTYRSEKYGFEFRYPGEMNPILDTKSGSTWGTEDEIMEEISLNKNEKSVLWVLHVSESQLVENRKRLQERSGLSVKNGGEKILQDEVQLSINGTTTTRIDYCSYSLAGVDCNFIMREYYFPMQDGTYIMMRADSWWSTEEDRSFLIDIVDSFNFISETD